ncbi:UDP-N-acetylmuramoyl-L-alanyl-D-glutamate--2,6-diaminopimelate ligase [Gammaproteobacteria bacterium 45_16_T64]|nr:UDP-N-acetylmuramoyl-L-alanyl-D-glutamate--2,6-diaminopimelate ligase [Gammaproteobacteria bacterium 45_16_T64]
MSHLLGELLEGIELPIEQRHCEVSGVALDSREVTKGDLFFALSGAITDGRKYIHCAVKKGAVAVIVDVLDQIDDEEFSIPVIAVPNLSVLTGQIAAKFWGAPSQSMNTVAVTGTNGKTSITQMIAQSTMILGQKSALIGTLGNGVYGKLQETINTTPDALSVQRCLAAFLKDDVDIVAMEASSHGLVQGRLSGTAIDIAVVTNISRDHLDYHGTMSAYLDAKTELVKWDGLQYVLLNADDADVMSLSSHVAEGVKRITFSHKSPDADVFAEDIQYTKQGLVFELVTPEGRGSVRNGMIGGFNVSNLLAVATVLYCLEYSTLSIANALCQMSQVPGRMEDVSGDFRRDEIPTVIVDFAHTPDALDNALMALKPHCAGQLWCVFGCGGDRDKGKRPEMGAIAVKHADKLIITADNPRSESTSDIIRDIEKGIDFGAAYLVETDRAQAIKSAIMSAAQDDVILLAGKGHELYQEINGVKHSYSDKGVAEINLQERLRLSGTGDKQC